MPDRKDGKRAPEDLFLTTPRIHRASCLRVVGHHYRAKAGYHGREEGKIETFDEVRGHRLDIRTFFDIDDADIDITAFKEPLDVACEQPFRKELELDPGIDAPGKLFVHLDLRPPQGGREGCGLTVHIGRVEYAVLGQSKPLRPGADKVQKGTSANSPEAGNGDERRESASIPSSPNTSNVRSRKPCIHLP